MSKPPPVRYFDLSGAVDVDPTIDQPAPDAFGPLTAGFGQRVLIGAWVVDAAGEIQPPAGLTVDIAVIWVTSIDVDRVPPTTPNPQKPWGRGPIAIEKPPGVFLTQAELGNVVGFTVAVTGKSASPAGMRLAIYATLGPRDA